MPERIISKYKRLFELRLLHHYWLDEGATLFDSLSETVKNKRLLNYDVRTFLNISPTPSSARALNALKAVFKPTGLGAVVGVPQDMVIPNDSVFEFVIRVNNAQFFNYTSLTLIEKKIFEFYHPTEKKTYRYKENVPLLSNLTGVSRGTNPNKSLYLSKEFPTLNADDQIEFLIQAGGKLEQLLTDQPAADTQELNADFSASPVFLHQGDIPAISPPAGLPGTPPSKGIQLSDDVPDDVFALIQIAAFKPGDNDFSCTSAGLAKDNHPVFQIHFKNRSTFWRYFNKNTGLPDSIESDPLPLTHFGNAGTKQKPSEGFAKKIKLSDAPGVVERLYSEIFV